MYAPPNSGKSTFVANMILVESWGFSGRHKNLISKEAAKVGDDNPYDPKVVDDPDTDCWPVEELHFRTVRDMHVRTDHINRHASVHGRAFF